ncbi:hypothetical protein QM565_01395 [Geitlerinema splendidum]|nr:hypothetical protein [Geitlerinema splendidum]
MANLKEIEERAIRAAGEALFRQHYVSSIDVLMGMGYLQPIHVQDWKNGKISYLEKAIPANLHKISHAMKCFRKWADQKGLKPSETIYLAKTRGPKRHLQFSKSGHPQIELAYRTHYISPLLSERKQEQLKEKFNQSPDLIVYVIAKDSQCSQCMKDLTKGHLLFMEGDQPLCLDCAELGDLIFLPSGDPMLTRRAKKYSEKCAVVLKFSRSRKRYERQGILIQSNALQKAQSNIKNSLSEGIAEYVEKELF